jgi:hypothetical protein
VSCDGWTLTTSCREGGGGVRRGHGLRSLRLNAFRLLKPKNQSLPVCRIFSPLVEPGCAACDFWVRKWRSCSFRCWIGSKCESLVHQLCVFSAFRCRSFGSWVFRAVLHASSCCTCGNSCQMYARALLSKIRLVTYVSSFNHKVLPFYQPEFEP